MIWRKSTLGKYWLC